MEIGEGDPSGQKAEVKGNGAAVNIAGASSSLPKFTPLHYIWFGLELISAAVLFYLAFIRPANGH